ncbi:T9SS-dependent choice-of-anchor J family protein [Chryseobacterium limigenitum]|uniref:Por secretion system C-terminal sorting domain-containing protein n=1 Tax=Chryseobacterium limigenitum TaxID=1612149 RepID=A0A1K2IVS7_9FLAO|nr:choice-of-anchor J domain-containing protein [Chryseobacterium limigenitum]SFZ96272.1 Por secretion system C-terminal sorting domain-containing protein [Chryseobacterium limigenitum]
MKKLLFLLLGLPVATFGQWTENFDAGTTLPAGWAVINNGGANGWEFGLPDSGVAQSGANVATITYDDVAHDDHLITKAINVQAGLSNRISFYIKSGLNSFPEDYEVLLSTTNQTAAAFTTVLQATQKAPSTWTKKTFNLSSYVGQTVYISIHATDTDQFQLYADTFVVDGIPTLGTSEIAGTKEITKVYPNPFADVLNISDVNNVKSVSVSDISGRLIKTIDKPSSEIHLGELKSGLYVVTLDMKDGSKQTVKAIKK